MEVKYNHFDALRSSKLIPLGTYGYNSSLISILIFADAIILTNCPLSQYIVNIYLQLVPCVQWPFIMKYKKIYIVGDVDYKN